MSDAIDDLVTHRAGLAARLDDVMRQAAPIRADIHHLESAIAVEIMRLSGHDVGDKVAVKIVEDRVRASLTRGVGIVERVAIGLHGKGWRIAGLGLGDIRSNP